MSSPSIAILLPVRNAASTLAEAVDSLRAQTHSDWHLLVWDDASDDASPDLLAAYAKQDGRITVVGHERVGIVEALRRLADHSDAPFLARMDADDVAHPERLARQHAWMAQHPSAGLCGTHVRMFGEHVGPGRRRYEAWINRLTDHDAIAREIFVECPIAHPTFLLRREAYVDAGGYQDHGWAEDYDLVFRIWRSGWKLGKVDAPLLDWRESADRLSMQDPRYGETAFRAVKRHYLRQTFLHGHERFIQWGAGEVGKPWLREWGVPFPPMHEHPQASLRAAPSRRLPEKAPSTVELGVTQGTLEETPAPESVVDIRPGKIGQTIHGVRVIGPDDLPAPGTLPIVVAVGTRGARQQIRAWLAPRGYTEGLDYVFLA